MKRWCGFFMTVCMLSNAFADGLYAEDFIQRTEWITNQPMLYMLFDFMHPPQEGHALPVEAKQSWGFLNTDGHCQIIEAIANDSFGNMAPGDDVYYNEEGLGILSDRLGEFDCLHYDFHIKGQPYKTSVTYHFMSDENGKLDSVSIVDHSDYVNVVKLPGRDKVAATVMILP